MARLQPHSRMGGGGRSNDAREGSSSPPQWTEQNRDSKLDLSLRCPGGQGPQVTPALGRRGGQHWWGGHAWVQPWPPTTPADPFGAHDDNWPLEYTGCQLAAWEKQVTRMHTTQLWGQRPPLPGAPGPGKVGKDSSSLPAASVTGKLRTMTTGKTRWRPGEAVQRPRHTSPEESCPPTHPALKAPSSPVAGATVSP